MDWRRIMWRRSHRQIGADVDEELSFHVAARMAALEARGYSAAEARVEALRRFGDVADTRSACVSYDARREQRERRRQYAGEAREDGLHALRQLRRRPGFAIVAVTTLGLGIGANAAIFAVADHVLLRPLPYSEAGDVVTLWERDTRAGTKHEAAAGNYVEWRTRATSFAALGLAEPYSYDITGDGPPEAVPAWRVADGWFEALGVQPVLGRAFEPADHIEVPRVVMISESYWRRQFGGARDVIGRTIRIDDTAVEIVGVVPHDQQYPESADLWTPKQFHPTETADRTSRYMPVVARLRPGVTIGQAQAEMDGIAAALATEYAATNATSGVLIVPLDEQILGSVRPTLLMLMGAVCVLLLIACTNLTNLLLARGAERRRELSVRAALGAGRARLGRQLVTETLVLALLGGATGLLVAYGAIRALVATAPPELPRVDTVQLDARVLLFLLLITIVAGLVTGAAPALRGSRTQLMTTLRSGRGSGGRERNTLRRVLVSAEVALALVLLVGAGLLGRSFLRLIDNDAGIEIEQRAFVQTFLWDRNPTDEQRVLRLQQMLERFRKVGGVTGAAAISALPFHPSQIDAQGRAVFEHRAPQAPDREARVFTTIATPEYFDVAGIPMVSGRAFTAKDRTGTQAVAIINETLARRYYGDVSPLGQRITVGVMDAPVTREIVGIVGDVRSYTLESEPRPEIYVPHAQTGSGSMTFLIATRTDPDDMLSTLRAALWDVDAGQTIYSSGTMRSLVAATIAERRLHFTLVAAFSSLALLLAIIGVYGLISFWTRTRVQEIGVRMALGARSSDIVRLIVSHAVTLVLPGVVIGLAAALAASRTVRHLLYEISATDPWTYAQLALLMFAVAVAAAFVPAWRAAAHDPQRALRD
jgi:putative ABC transport system permease protein